MKCGTSKGYSLRKHSSIKKSVLQGPKEVSGFSLDFSKRVGVATQ
jgi:hypothetical protein